MLYFSHVKKAYTANQNGVQLFFTCESITNQRCKRLCEPIRIMHRLHSNAFQIWRLFQRRRIQIFPAKAEESSRFVSVGCCSEEFLWHQENTNTSSKSQRDVSLLKQSFSFEERAERESENIGATDLDELIVNFLLQVSEFLFLICVKKPISMKILVLHVINSSRHRNCFVRGYIHSLFV